MKIKKLLAGLLSATILSMATLTVLAQPIKDLPVAKNLKEPEEIMLISEKEEIGHEFKFGSFTGTVVEINEFSPVEGRKIMALEDQEGMPINMVVSKDTYVVNNDKITVGARVTGYFDANAPMILIYPPQYSPKVIVVENEDYHVKVDIFNEGLVSADNMLKLNISEDTKIVTQDGEVFKGKLVGEKLVVIYDVSTKSIPAQTTPIKVIVLDQDGVEEPEDTKDTEDTPLYDVEIMDIVVNGKKIDSLSAYTAEAPNGKGFTMVPLRPVAEALGLEVVWEGKLESIRVGLASTLKIDQDDYTFAKMAPIKLGMAPELVEGVTFVPLGFFTEVLQMDQAEELEGQIIIK